MKKVCIPFRVLSIEFTKEYARGGLELLDFTGKDSLLTTFQPEMLSM